MNKTDDVRSFSSCDLFFRIGLFRNGCTQLWIVMPFFPRGTLFDYLQQNTLSLEETFNLAKSAAAGLCYLHSVITGVHGKPGIVHRDVKSKNILIQSNLTCCIADLGLAIVNHSTMGMEWNGVYKVSK
ncbi:Receptor protein serine/threonine kinase [Fasciolopsis buskii]|uniref:receptor protein serine/threonine kinase n=1 Tax=Fasciolopsis buskii TaxID=27845 RepID=A0A8E0VGI0_9TREM|nr:Receptor protein serine/threonine kinase [Fasciolopsis buski]